MESSTHDEFYISFTASAERFVAPEVQKALRESNILIAGAGSVGSPIAMMALRSGCENITVADPDTVDYTNLSRQEYQYDQVGHNKAIALVQNMLAVNPFAVDGVLAAPEGITYANIADLVCKAKIVIDAVDITALDMIWELHSEAARQKKPVLVGYDLAGTAMVAVYRYDEGDIDPLDGVLKQEDIQMFLKVRNAYQSGQITKAQLLDFVYSSFTGPINPLYVPIEQYQELLLREEDDDRTYQVGTTARVLSSLTIEAIKCIHAGVPIKRDIHVDLPSIVRSRNPNILTKLPLIARALNVIRQREVRVNNILANLSV